MKSRIAVKSWARSRRASPTTLILCSVGTLAALAIATALAATSRYVACVFPDGESYCEMAAGHRGAQPFSRRPLVPFVVRVTGRVLDLSVGDSFWVVTGVGVILLAGATYLLGFVLAGNLGVAGSTRHGVATGAVLLWLAAPHPIRAWMVAPVLSDPVGSALLTSWLALMLARHGKSLRVLAVVIAVVIEVALVLAAAIARESTVALVLVSCAVAVATNTRTKRDVMPAAIAAVVGLLVALLQPSQSLATRAPYHWSYKGSIGEIADNIRHWLQDPVGVARGVLVGVGAGVIALSPAIWRRIGSRYGVAKTTGSGLGVIAATTGTALGLALIGGRDLGRLSSVAAPFLCIAVSLYLFALTSRRQIVVTLLGIATTLVAVGAFVTQRLDELGYERFTLGRNIGWIELASVAVVVVVTTVMSLSASAESELGIE